MTEFEPLMNADRHGCLLGRKREAAETVLKMIGNEESKLSDEEAMALANEAKHASRDARDQ